MANVQLHSVLRHLRQVLELPAAESVPDDQLLHRFTAARDEAAFAGLVQRHGGMVLAVCRSVLCHAQDAEDAFQATFVLLAVKAASIRRHESLTSWLHRVAFRLALKMKTRAANRRAHELCRAERQPGFSMDDMTWRELRGVLHEELNRLPEKYRVPLLLCYLEGKTRDEAARQLGWTAGAFKGRLERARDLLRHRLTRRGLAPGAALLTTMFFQKTAAALPAALVRATVPVASASLAGPPAAAAIPESVRQLVREGLHTMVLNKLKLASILVLAVGLLALGAGHWAHRALADKPDPPPRAIPGGGSSAPAHNPATPKTQVKPALPAEQTTVSGRVLDAAEKPVARAAVAVIGRPRPHTRNGVWSGKTTVLGQGRADARGRFRLQVTQLSSARFWDVTLLATAPGHGLSLRPLEVKAKPPEATLRLAREQVLRGRLLDLQGLPAAKARVVAGTIEGKPSATFGPVKVAFQEPPRGLAAWPAAATTDAKGRFELRGFGPDDSVTLEVLDDRFARQSLLLNPQPSERAMRQQLQRAGGKPAPFQVVQPKKGQSEDFTWTVTPARTLTGTVTYGDTGKPAANARLVIYSSAGSFAFDKRQDTRTDQQGRFRLVPHEAESYTFFVYPPDGEPYVLQNKSVGWAKRDAVQQAVDFVLPRGIRVKGRVIEKPSGKPAAGAGVEYFPRIINNKFYRTDRVAPFPELKQLGVSGPDGQFELTVLPGPGHLLINGPTLDYLHVETNRRQLDVGKAGGLRYYPNALVELDLKPEARTHEVNVTLRRGVTVKGPLVGPDGKPVKGAVLVTRSYIPYGYVHNPVWYLPLKDGELELHGCDPDRPQDVFILDAKNQWGTVAKLGGKKAGGKPVTVCLERCGSATVRFIDEAGQPIKDARVLLEVLMTPGVTRWEAQSSNSLSADSAFMTDIEWERHRNLRPDGKGRFTLPTLIPGATYRILVQVPQRGIVNTHKTFTVKAGETLDLKDLTIKAAK